MSEGVIDQGGGFRDSLSDLSEELCPISNDTALPFHRPVASHWQTFLHIVVLSTPHREQGSNSQL
jgi:hypothetical protein